MQFYFYPRPPRGGRRGQRRPQRPPGKFLSTPSARRATAGHLHGPVPDWISIHALREEGDFSSHMDANRALNFYPRPPRGGRRGRSSNAQCPSKISIHALREEGDNSFQCSQSSRLDFYPRPPRGGRPYVAGYVTKKTYDFYPRPPRGGRLRHSSKLQQDKGYFYPRPPRGGRLCIPCACWLCPRFLSTPSARRATAHKCPHCAGLHISIHALREEGDLPWLSLCSAIGKFLSTPSARRATDAPLIWATSLMYFYPRPLRGGRQPSVSAPGCNYIFLSTPSARRATGESCHRGCRRDISIHALCEEGDA